VTCTNQFSRLRIHTQSCEPEYLCHLNGQVHLLAILWIHEIPNIDLVTHGNFLYFGFDLMVQFIIIVIG
jgi:hypothetical protein